MPWQVAIVLDQGESQETLHANLFILLGQMPVWAVAKYDRVPGAAELGKQWASCWAPEPALTVAPPVHGDDRITEIADLIPTISEHHPRLSGINLFGVDPSPQLQSNLAELGYVPVPDPDSTYPDRLRFAKPINHTPDVPIIRLDASRWRSHDDFYQAFFTAVGAPEWHGRNFNALNDSIGTGGINKAEVPYRIVIGNAKGMSSDAEAFVKELDDLIKHLRRNGCPVDLVVEQS